MPAGAVLATFNDATDVAVSLVAPQGSGINNRNLNDVTINGTDTFNISSTQGIVFGAAGGGNQVSGDIVFNTPVNIGGNTNVNQVDAGDTAGALVFNNTIQTGTGVKTLSLTGEFDGTLRFGAGASVLQTNPIQGLRVTSAAAPTSENRVIEFGTNISLERIQINQTSATQQVILRATGSARTYTGVSTVAAITAGTSTFDRVVFDGSEDLTVKAPNVNTFTIIGSTATSGGNPVSIPVLNVVQSGSGDVTFDGRILAATATQTYFDDVKLIGSGTGDLNVGAVFGGNTLVDLVVDRAAGSITRLTGAQSSSHNIRGTTDVTSGTFLINMATSGNGNYTVAAAGGLGGTGTINTISNATVTMLNGSTLTPGDAAANNGVGTFALDLNNSQQTNQFDLSAMNTNSRIIFDLATTATSDLITLVNGTLNIGTLNSSEFKFNQLAGFGAGTYKLFDTTNAIVGTLDTAQFTIGSSWFGELAYADDTNDIVLNVTAVPEPSAALLVLAGFATLTLRRRRR